MKRVLVLGLVALSACAPAWLESGRYACERGQENQCPGAWRCGVEGYCHQLGDTTTAWRCEADEDCEGGFTCGLAKSREFRECHDPAAPQDWACEVPGDCTGGWTCGLSRARTGQCHDPAHPEDWPCNTALECVAGWQCGLSALGGRECHDPARPQAWACLTPADCLGGWSCGLNDARTARECHDPAQPRSFSCAEESDCLAGWRCGLAANRLQRECHDPQVPQAFACVMEDDCLGGWRCGQEQLCLDPSGDALGATPPFDGGAAIISPVGMGRVDAVSISPVFEGTAIDTPTLAVRQGERLGAIIRPGGGTTVTWDLGLSSAVAVIAQGPRCFLYDANNDTFTRDVLNHVYAAEGDGGLSVYELLPNGAFTKAPIRYASTIASPPPVTAFKHGIAQGDEVPYMVGFSERPDRFIVFDGPHSGIGRDFGSINRPGNRVLDMDSVYAGSQIDCIFAVDTAGLWVAQFPDNDFEPLHSAGFGNGTCAPSGLKVERFSSASGNRAAVVASPWDGGSPQVALWDLNPMLLNRGGGTACTSFSGNPCLANDLIPYDVEIGPCQACPGGTLLDLAVIEGVTAATTELEARCGSPDGGAHIFYRLARRPGVPGACNTRPLVGPGSLFLERGVRPASQPSQRRTAFVGRAGQIWFGSSAVNATSLTFDRAATGVALKGTRPDDVVAISGSLAGYPNPTTGLTAAPLGNVTAIGTNEPSWAVLNDQVVALEGASAIESGRGFAIAPSALTTPQTLYRALSSQGETVAVLTAGNQLYSAEVSGALSGLQPPALLGARVAQVNAITSAAFTSSPDAGSFLEGYLVTAAGLAHVTADTATRWRAEDVPLPSSLAPLEAWFSAGRGRVGFTDGTVYSLPSRVRIAEPVAGDAVEDYVQACGQQLALTGAGLFRLEAVAGSAIGQWIAVDLPAGFAPDGLFGGRVHAVNADVYVFSRVGEAARLTISPCAP
ncbi:MAG: hypothetical protein Q8L48_03485 [Archangium sp.]|nr:hypothetical protein [Archangium sp.]